MNIKKSLVLEKAFNLALKNPRENTETAENLFKEILKKKPNNFQANFFLGILSAINKKFDIAKKLLNKATEIDPTNSNAYANLGNVLKELKEYNEAINCYEKSIQIQSDNIISHQNFGNLLNELKKYQKAKVCYEKVIHVQPNNITVLNNLGNVLKELKEYKKAISCYEKAIKIQPNYVTGYKNLGNILKELGEFERAKKFYQTAIHYDPEDLFNLYQLSKLDEKILDQSLKNKIYNILQTSNSKKMNMVYGNFLLSRYELKSKKYQNEFDYLIKGHNYYYEIEKQKFEKQVEFYLTLLPKQKNLISLSKHSKNTIKNKFTIKPIFIIGVPRCGSTLIEKVIASGTQHIPIGEETDVISHVVQNFINQN